jgi:hypothetical protein
MTVIRADGGATSINMKMVGIIRRSHRTDRSRRER